MNKLTKMLAMAGTAALTVAILPSCGDKKEDSNTAANTQVDAKTETINLELTGLN